jgi:hypothetical protein
VPHRSQSLNPPTSPISPAATRNRDSSCKTTSPSPSAKSFLPGSGQNVECDVTYSKQTIGEFLPGATTAHFASRKVQWDARCGFRSAGVSPALLSLEFAPFPAHHHSSCPLATRHSPLTTHPSNRECELLESSLTHRKQTVAPRSNRELSTNPCFCNSDLRRVCSGHWPLTTRSHLTDGLRQGTAFYPELRRAACRIVPRIQGFQPWSPRRPLRSARSILQQFMRRVLVNVPHF